MVEQFAPEKVILYSYGEACGYGSLARGEARWDSDADILMITPFEGSSFKRRLEMLEAGNPSLPVDLLLCRRKLHSRGIAGVFPLFVKRLIKVRCCMAELTPLITAWICFAAEDWDDAQILARCGGKQRSICLPCQPLICAIPIPMDQILRLILTW